MAIRSRKPAPKAIKKKAVTKKTLAKKSVAKKSLAKKPDRKKNAPKPKARVPAVFRVDLSAFPPESVTSQRAFAVRGLRLADFHTRHEPDAQDRAG